LGVNVLTALTDYGELAQTAFKEGIDFIFLGAGLPLHKPKAIPDETWLQVLTKVVPIVSSGRAATLVCRYWEKNYHMVPDGFVLEGPMAGGHLGFSKAQLDLPEYRLENLLPEVLAAVKPYQDKFGKPISVVAGGGIFTGEDIHKFLALGAHGVQMATRFVATHECDASDGFKQSYLNSRKEDLIIIDSPVGLPGRAIRNPFLDKVSNGLKHPVKCPWKCLLTCDFSTAPYCIAEALLKAKKGELEWGFAFAGANAYRIDKIVSVKELIDSLLEEYARCVEKAATTAPMPV
jgi:NAD(P)H-dependent flavin oxidoreductase YrpB (nitropropane dioxygenase family)